MTPNNLSRADMSSEMLELYEQNYADQASQGGSEVEGGSTSNVTASCLPLRQSQPMTTQHLPVAGLGNHQTISITLCSRPSGAVAPSWEKADDKLHYPSVYRHRERKRLRRGLIAQK